jgi:hypothetical protein
MTYQWYWHALAVVLAYGGHLLMAYGTVHGGPPIVSLGALMIGLARTLE